MNLVEVHYRTASDHGRQEADQVLAELRPQIDEDLPRISTMTIANGRCVRCLYTEAVSARAKDARWNLRVAPADDFVVRKAAEESNRELSEFVRSAAVVEAERTMADRTIFTLDDEHWDRLTEVLDRPPRVPAGLKELFSRPSVFE